MYDTDQITTLKYSRPVFFIEINRNDTVKKYPIKSLDDSVFAVAFPNEVDMLKKKLLPTGAKIPNSSIIINGDYAQICPAYKPYLFKGLRQKENFDKWSKQQDDIEELLSILTKLHKACLYKLGPNDDRITHVDHKIFIEVTTVLEKHK